MAKKDVRVVVIGGGFGGVKTALNLANKPGFSVQLISNNTHFEYHGALYRSAVGHSPMEVVIPLREIFQDAKNVEVVLDSIAAIDEKKKRLASESGTIYAYDVAIFAMGNTVNYYNIEGLEEHSETMNDIASTVKLRHRFVKLFQERAGKPARVAVVGAGASGVELASELPHFAALVAKKYQLKKARLSVVLVEGSDRVLPLLSPKASEKVKKRLHDLGVEVHLDIRVQSCEPGQLCMSAGNLGADIIVWAAGSQPVRFYNAYGNVFTLGRGGRVVVDEFLRAQGQKDIYVLGDNADTKYSGMAQTALYDANFVTRNLLRQQAKKKMKAYRARKPLYVVTVGQKWAIVEDGKLVFSGKRGWAVRRRADLAIFKNFQPYKEAIKTWRQANKMSKF